MSVVKVNLDQLGHVGELLDGAAKLPEETLMKPASEGHWSLFETLKELVATEDIAVSRYLGEEPLNQWEFYRDELSELPALREIWEKSSRRAKGFYEGLTDETFNREFTRYSGEKGIIGEALTWYTLHYWHHSGEAIQLFKLYSPKETPTFVVKDKENPENFPKNEEFPLIGLANPWLPKMLGEQEPHTASLIGAAAKLDRELLHRPVSEGHWSLYDTLRHIVAVGDMWVSWMAGEDILQKWEWYEALSELDAVAEANERLSARAKPFFESLSGDDLTKEIKSAQSDETIPLGDTLAWYMAHYWHHSGECIQLFKLYAPRGAPRWVEHDEEDEG